MKFLVLEDFSTCFLNFWNSVAHWVRAEKSPHQNTPVYLFLQIFFLVMEGSFFCL